MCIKNGVARIMSNAIGVWGFPQQKKEKVEKNCCLAFLFFRQVYIHLLCLPLSKVSKYFWRKSDGNVWKCGGKHVAEVWHVDGNVASNGCYLYPSKSPSTTGLTTNVGTDFPYALSRKIPFRFARGIFSWNMGLGVAQIFVTGGPVTMLAKEKKTHYETQKRFVSIDRWLRCWSKICEHRVGHCTLFWFHLQIFCRWFFC